MSAVDKVFTSRRCVATCHTLSVPPCVRSSSASFTCLSVYYVTWIDGYICRISLSRHSCPRHSVCNKNLLPMPCRYNQQYSSI